MTRSETSIITPRSRHIGDLEVRRVLPSAGCRAVGPFVFFDHMGPVKFAAGKGLDVRPHPHIGLATITYLFEGEIIHRDSLGFEQVIRPGDVNLMTAGRGIVHSERTASEARPFEARLHGIQSWIALPAEYEESAPAFYHQPARVLPEIRQGPVMLRLIVGDAFGRHAPLTTFSPMFYLDASMPAQSIMTLPPEYEERAAYVAEGEVAFEETRYTAGSMIVFAPGEDVAVTAQADSRVMLLGGAPLGGPRHLWWNFVSSRPERIEQAKDDWKNNRFPRVSGDTEFIPLPEK